MKKYILMPFLALLVISCSETPRFELMDPQTTGITFNNTITETDSFHCLSYEYIYNGAGVGIGDLNNDGLQDIVFAGNQVLSRVYLNRGEFRFDDITSNMEGLSDDQWFSSVTIADINSDGWADIYFTSTASNNPEKCKNRLWVNQGLNGRNLPYFKEMAEEFGIAEKGQSVNAAFFDYDLDGDLDLYILNNTLTQRMNTSYRAKIVDGSAGNNDQLYRNNGDNTFTNVTIEAGIIYEGFGLGLALGDVNKDGYPDIYVSNDYMSNDLLYINQGDGTFKNEIRKYMSYQAKSSMGNDMADINNDGNPDMFTLDMMPEKYYKKKQTINGFSYIFYVNDEKFGYEHQFLRNMLQLHNGFLSGEMLPYSEIGQYLGIYATEWSWSPLFADYDNDGDKDLIVTNGYPKDMTDKDWTYYKVRVWGSVADEKHVISLAPPVKVQNYAFENTGDLHFRKVSEEWLPEIPTYSYGASFADLDNDGDLDYVVNNLDDNAFVLRNTTAERSKSINGYLRIKLTGRDPNRNAIGAKVELWSKGSLQFTENFLTRGYASSVDPVIHFGIAAGEIIDSLKITWPASGNVTLLKEVKANQTLEISETGSVPARSALKGLPGENLMFIKSDSVLRYLHKDRDYIDFFYHQMIIPHKFSQIGPKMASGDINGDGLEDIIIGSTNIIPTTVFINTGSGYVKTEFEGLTTQKEFAESDLAIFDADGDGDNDIATVAGGYENPEETEYKHYIYINTNNVFTREALPVPPFIASVIRTNDFDKDGDIDLFIGARVKKRMFPYSSYSWLLINENGTFRTDSLFRFNLGMVTDATWSDYDGDGWDDLVVAREWNTLAVVKNGDGNKMVPQVLPGFEKYNGLWYSVAAGDFDNDGDTDYIAGNLGENNRFTISEKYPLGLYAIDIDLDGTIDPISTAYYADENGKMKEYPINYLDELQAQSVFFQKSFKNFVDFSYKGIEDIMDENVMKGLEFKLEVNTASSFVLWNDKGKFTWEKLPQPLQFSPVKKMIVRDLNGDKYPDVIIGGNDHTFDIATGYYDAAKGFIMMSRGDKRSFEVLPPSKSGFLLNGMVESLLWIDGKQPEVVAGINRSDVVVFRVNRPGNKH